jgi:hypothetical protein
MVLAKTQVEQFTDLEVTKMVESIDKNLDGKVRF